MSAGTSSRRIASMDQFRGYTVAGMFLVNFLGVSFLQLTKTKTCLVQGIFGFINFVLNPGKI